MRYYIKNMSDFPEEKQKEYFSFLDEEKKEQFLSSKNENRKKSTLFSHGFAKEIIADEYNIKREDLIFSVTENGKPFCKSHSYIHFSISHSDKYSAVAISEKEIGIDIETYKEPTEKLIDRVCSENEKKFISLSDNKAKAFTEIWTKKEAYLKALGTGIDRELKSVDTQDKSRTFITEYFDDFVLSVFSL